MNCFNHQNKESVGICKNCNKALCIECAVDTGFGLTCIGNCEKELKEVDELIQFNRSRVKKIKKIGRLFPIFVYLFVAIGVIFILHFINENRRENAENRYSAHDSLYDKIELGIVNTFWMDTAMLSTRKIYFNYDFNELTCGWLIKVLWLLDSRSNEPIDLYICSSGGYIAEAKAIGNAIQSLKSKVNTYATGHCASSALRTVSCGTGIRAAFCNTMMMFHGDDFNEDHTERSYDAVAKGIETEDWKRISKIPDSMVVDSSEFNMTPQKAVELGFIDTVICR